MPRVGMEPIRREALVKATIAEIGQAGSLDVTVAQIARRAGMSSALAHHYFGGKEDMSNQGQTALAALLLHDPNLLMLDEPTNFLDLRTQILLEHFLKNFPAACLIAILLLISAPVGTVADRSSLSSFQRQSTISAPAATSQGLMATSK